MVSNVKNENIFTERYYSKFSYKYAAINLYDFYHMLFLPDIFLPVITFFQNFQSLNCNKIIMLIKLFKKRALT